MLKIVFSPNYYHSFMNSCSVSLKRNIIYLCFVLGALFIAVGSSAQTILASPSKYIYDLKPYDGPLPNPHKGFTVPSTNSWCLNPIWDYAPGGSLDNQAWNVITHGNGYIRWDKLHTGRGEYNWDELDKVLERHEEHGLGYALRVFPYSSSKGQKNNFTIEEDYDWTPKFIYAEGAKKTYATLPIDGVEHTLAVPVWDDSIYLQAHKEFAAALAERYDGDPRIEYIDIRCFGNWGEWHVAHFTGTQMPSEEIQKDMLSYYASLFHKTLLVLPSSGRGEVYEHALSLGITKRDDGLIGTPDREKTLIAAYEANLPTIGENLGPYAMMLEYNDIIPGGYLKWTLDRWKNVIYTAHLTYYVLDQDSDAGYRFYNDNKVHVDSMTKVLGYNFRITDAEFQTVPDMEKTTGTLKITVKNTGVAPCFFDVYMVAELVDSTGSVLSKLGETIKIPKGTFKDEMTQDFEFADTIGIGLSNISAQNGAFIALSLYEGENDYINGKNPTVRFDNDGLQGNNKLLLKSFTKDDIETRLIDFDNTNNNVISVYTSGNGIYVKNVNGKKVCLYNSKGELYESRIASMNELQFSVQNKGVYFVVVENQQQTVIVK